MRKSWGVSGLVVAFACAWGLSAPVRAERNVRAVSLQGPSASLACDSLELDEALAVGLENLGDEPIDVPFEVLIFEDVDGDGAHDPLVDTSLGTATVLPPLGPGEAREVIVASAGLLEYREALLHAWVDAERVVAESDESDNVVDSSGACRRAPPTAAFDPVVEWEWVEENVDQTPMVGDVNADGTPDVVFVSEVRILHVLDGRDGSEIWRATGSRELAEWAQLALAELDGDPGLEIVVLARDSRHLVAFDDDGSEWWVSEEFADSHRGPLGGVTLADLDCDGRVEAVFGREVFDAHSGAHFWTPEPGGTLGTNTGYAGFPTTVDLDGDGDLEVLGGPTAYTWRPLTGMGEILWRQTEVPDGYSAVGQFDDDEAPEVVIVYSGRIWLLEGDTGEVIWERTIPNGDGGCIVSIVRGGAPTVADFDGDGAAEIGVAGADWFVVFEGDGSVLWQSPIEDCSSSFTSATVFDFEDDGAAEVVYQDETTLRVLRGTDGSVLASAPISSLTWNEMVTVADVDGDNRAEIVAPLNDTGGGAFRGIRVYGDRADNWVNTRRIWNQHAYHVDNVLDDGRVPPAGGAACQERSWLTHGTFRAQRLGAAGGDAQALPDLTLSLLASSLDASDPCHPQQLVELRVGSSGAIGSGAPTDVVAYFGDPAAGGRMVGSATVPALEPGEWWPLELQVPAREPGQLHLLVDDDGSGSGTGVLNECREDNNSCLAVIDVGAQSGPSAVGPVLMATGHGDPHAPDISARFEWTGDQGLPRLPGEHYHLTRGRRADLLQPVPGSEPWSQLTWDDVTPRSSELPTCHFLRVVAADACEQEEQLP